MMGKKQGFHKMGTEEHSLKPQAATRVHKQQQRKWSRVCCGVCLLVLLSLLLVAIALSQTVFKFRDPKVSLTDVKLQNVSLNLDSASLSMLLSVTLAADVQVDNPNYYDFTCSNSTMRVVYHGEQVGVVELGAGTIRSHNTVALPAAITLEAVRLVVDSIQDLTAGVASLTLDAAISGRVNLAHIFKRHVTVILICNVDILLSNRKLKQTTCKKTIKL